MRITASYLIELFVLLFKEKAIWDLVGIGVCQCLVMNSEFANASSLLTLSQNLSVFNLALTFFK